MTSVPRLYRSLLRLAALATPPERSLWATTQVKTRFALLRTHDASRDELRLRAEADDAMRFLKVVARQRVKADDADAINAIRSRGGVTRIAIDPLTGQILNSSSSSSSTTTNVSSSTTVFRDQRITSDQIERHQKLWRRQHFMDRK
jgi:hypothetical protein